MNKFKFVLFFLVLLGGLSLSGFKTAPEPENPVKFYSLSKGIYVVDINTKKCPDCITPYVSDSLETVESVGEKTSSYAAINAGFFDPGNAMTTSYVVKDGCLVADPTKNNHLTDNVSLQKYLPAIFNRSEFRVLSCQSGDKVFDIARHNDKPQAGCEITHSVQAGPLLVPDFLQEEESFVVRKNGKVIKQSAGALGKYARSAIALKGDHVLLVAISNKSPMTLKELADFMHSLKVDKAMAFDGGSSTSLYVDLSDKSKFIINSAKDDSARRVKSIILVSQ